MAVKIEQVRLIKGGVISGENKGSGTLTTSDAYYSFGGDTDLWGLTLTPADINSTNFGVVVAFSGWENTDAYSPETSNYIKVSDFGFSIPTDETITGIKVEIEAKTDASNNAFVDHIRITAYTPSVEGLPITIDNVQVKSITIDGEEVKGLTIDGETVF